MFGVCYGHQLLAHALGGKVGYNPTGSELGTQTVELLPPAAGDQLLDGLPASFPAQMLHAQTVLQPPPGAAVLARSDQDPHQMFRVGPNVFSTQFHPEFGPDFVRAHLERYQRKYMAENLTCPAWPPMCAPRRSPAGCCAASWISAPPPPAVRNKRSARRPGIWHHFSSAQSRAPEEPHPMNRAAAPEPQHAAAVERACRALEAEQPPDLNTLAEQAGMSRFHFHRVFKAATGVTPKAYATALRASRARQQLRESASVTDAMYDAGFNSSGRFYEAAPAMLGMTPTAYRQHGAGVDIRFAVAQCSLGALLVAASAIGICEIALHEDPEHLVRGLQERFSKARLIGADAEFERWVARWWASSKTRRWA